MISCYYTSLRYLLQMVLTRIWAKKGTRPRKVKQRQFISTYLYGAACHQTGQSYAAVLPYANTKAMNIFLQGLSKEINEGKHVALIIDNAGWHNSNELIVPDNNFDSSSSIFS